MRNEPPQRKERELSSKKLLLIFGIALAVLIVFCLIWFLTTNSRAKAEASVEVTPDNHYTLTLYAVTDRDYKPFSYIKPDGSYAGMDVEIIAEIANRMDRNLKLELLDWNEAKERILNGEADLILNMELDSVTEDSGMIATIPVESKEYVVYGKDRVEHVGELHGKRIGSMQKFPELGLKKEITVVSSYREMFEKLDAGGFDYVICPLQVGDSLIAEMHLNNIGSSYVIKEMFGCIAMRADRAPLRNRINVILEELQNEGFLHRMDEKWIIHYENTSISGFFRNHLVLLIVLIVVILAVIMLAILMIKDTKHLRVQKAFNEELKEKVDTIERQKEELETEKKRAEAANKVKTTFLFNMSHDIRTPLNAIIGSAEIARAHVEDTKEVTRCLERISIGGTDLLQLLNDVLEMANVEDHKLKLEPAVFELPMVIRELELTMGELAEKKNQEFTASVEDVVTPHVLCDAIRLRQILRNLLVNAVKFTPEGGHIQLRLKQLPGGSEDGGLFEFCVKDDGCGMEPDFVENAFKAFERGQTSTESGQQGTGVGLPIVKSLVELMNGKIRVKTAPGKGTEVVVQMEFPLYTISKDTGDEAKQAAENKSLVGRKILLVDDIEINREIAEMFLSTMGCIVEIAEDGAQAVEKVKAACDAPYDLILMDIQMPVMDGYEATRTIRAMTDNPVSSVPIIALTANTFDEDKQRARESGMNAIVPKPLEPDVLQHTLQQYMLAL